MNFETWDMVTSPIFGKWLVIETYWEKVVVNFENKLFWLKTVSQEIFTADKKRLIKKKDIKPDPMEEHYYDQHKDDAFITNDNLV